MVQVEISNHPVTCRFATPKEALQYASSQVYLGPLRLESAMKTLESGNVFKYAYGFNEVCITPNVPVCD